MIDPKTGLAIASTAMDFLGGLKDDTADEVAQMRQEMANRQMRQQQWNQYLMSMGQRASEQGDDRMKFAGHVSGKEALLPLMDQGFTALQNRFRQGPANLGQVGAQNSAMQSVGAAYQPGQNASINRYGGDLEAIKRRFMQRPALDDPDRMRALASGRPDAGWNQR